MQDYIEILQSKKISYSLLKAYENGLEYLKGYLLDEIPKSKAYYEGTLFHKYILEPNEFNKEYVVADINKPVNNQQKIFANTLIEAKLSNIDDIIKVYSSIYSTKDKSTEKVAKEATTAYMKLKQYVDFSISEQKYISSREKEALDHCLNGIRANDFASELLFNNIYEGTHNEITIEAKFNDVEIKGILDRLVIDNENKVIKIIDLKTYSTSSGFENSAKRCVNAIEDYNYVDQLAFYLLLLMSTRDFIDGSMSDYRMEYYIVFAGKNNNHSCNVFKIDNDLVEETVNEIIVRINSFKNHIKLGIDKNIEYINNKKPIL